MPTTRGSSGEGSSSSLGQWPSEGSWCSCTATSICCGNLRVSLSGAHELLTSPTANETLWSIPLRLGAFQPGGGDRKYNDVRLGGTVGTASASFAASAAASVVTSRELRVRRRRPPAAFSAASSAASRSLAAASRSSSSRCSLASCSAHKVSYRPSQCACRSSTSPARTHSPCIHSARSASARAPSCVTGVRLSADAASNASSSRSARGSERGDGSKDEIAEESSCCCCCCCL
mmetsp:Transcript_1727/g.4602  ORF Transcript_1727/g.4602 Transcript_1727/m.4602 type:complete len:233 (-) Transcript_1727:1757-2455(-)